MGSETTRGESMVDSGGGRWILVVVGSGDLRTYPLGTKPIVIGRDPACDVVLVHHKVSRRHARLALLAGGYTIEDLGSRNGIQVLQRTGATIPPNRPVPVQTNVPFSVGPFTLVAVVERDAPPASQLEIEDPLATAQSPLLVSIAKSGTNVLVRGESGVGKQMLAETLHRLAGRGGRLVSINCAAIASDLLESELFGHEKGAFTGALAAKPGLLEVAGDGTVLLDEIGDMPPELQAKLLRAVESREVLRVGSTQPTSIRARFLSATHRDLLGDVESKRFRLDLYYRLAGVTLVIPPLRERRGRITQLARELVVDAAARANRPPPTLSPAAAARLQAHDWPGNVRELRNVLDRALIFAIDREVIDTEHIVFDQPPAPSGAEPALTADETAERDRIVAALAECGGNQTRAAKELGMARSTLVTKLSILRIQRPRK